jgi:polysaccharide export outer membrane protein
MSKRSLGNALLIAAIAGLGGCAGDHNAKPGVYQGATLSAFGQTSFVAQNPTEYRLEPNDVVSIKVYGEPDMSSERVVIDPSGTINIDFVGNLHASGLTAAEFSAALRQQLASHIRDPQVAVNLVEYGSQRVTVEGSVVHPGVFVVPPGTTLLGALASAGDPDRFGRVRKIVIFRNEPSGRTVALFDLHQIRSGAMIDPVVKGNDRIIVGVSGTSRFYQDLLQLVPAAAIFAKY